MGVGGGGGHSRREGGGREGRVGSSVYPAPQTHACARTHTHTASACTRTYISTHTPASPAPERKHSKSEGITQKQLPSVSSPASPTHFEPGRLC